MDENFGEEPDFGALLESPAVGSSSVTRTTTKPSTPPTKVQQPTPQAMPIRRGPASILVSTRQKGNPILNHVKLLPWEYADIPADYVLGATTCALFLSLKYHRLHPEYVYSRVKALRGKYTLRILLIMVDIPNHEDSLKELSKTSIVNNLTIILCWSTPEAAHYLELFKSSENAQPTAIRSQQAQSYNDSLVEFITTPRSINKSDAASLISTFGSLQAGINARPEQISAVPGWGERKVTQWSNAVQEEFRTRASAKRGRPSAAAAAIQATGAGKSNSLENEISPFSDEEEAQEELEHRKSVPGDPEEPLDEGVMAALAKLRDTDG